MARIKYIPVVGLGLGVCLLCLHGTHLTAASEILEIGGLWNDPRKRPILFNQFSSVSVFGRIIFVFIVF